MIVIEELKATKTFGSLKFVECEGKHVWEINAEPHVMIKLKALFGRIYKSSFENIRLSHSPEVCRDLEWFISRYPLQIDSESEVVLRRGSKHYQKTLAELEVLVLPERKPRKFDLAIPLRDYQARATEIYLRSRALISADQVGLGKTAEVIASFTEPATLPALVVCQTHLGAQWEREIKKFLPDCTTHIIKGTKPYNLPTADVYIITYSKLSGWANLLGTKPFSKPFLKSVAFDEVQELRKTGTDKYNAAKAIRAQCEYAFGLSATPIYNYGGEFWNVADVIVPGRLGELHEFIREWCYGRSDKSVLSNPKAFGTYLQEQFIMIRRTRAEVGIELPPFQRLVQSVPYDPKVLEKIDMVATELAHLILKGSFHESGQAAREFDLKLRQSTGIAKAPYVAEFIKMLLNDEPNVLLFGWHRDVYDIWLEALKDFNPVLYTGSETPAQKQKSLDAFINGESRVLAMSLRSAVGVDGLQNVCNCCVFGEMDWSPGVHEQAEGRLHRPGSTNSVCSFYMVAEAGSDPPMAEVLGLKKAQIQGLLLEQGETKAFAQSDTDRVKRMAQDYLKRK